MQLRRRPYTLVVACQQRTGSGWGRRGRRRGGSHSLFPRQGLDIPRYHSLKRLADHLLLEHPIFDCELFPNVLLRSPLEEFLARSCKAFHLPSTVVECFAPPIARLAFTETGPPIVRIIRVRRGWRKVCFDVLVLEYVGRFHLSELIRQRWLTS